MIPPHDRDELRKLRAADRWLSDLAPAVPNEDSLPWATTLRIVRSELAVLEARILDEIEGRH